jgi:hypothetical protein
MIKNFLPVRFSLAIIFSFITLSSGIVFAQTVFEPTTSSVYDFLNRLSVKGIIIFNDEVRPLSRIELSEKLVEAEKQKNKLSILEQDELAYYLKEYFPELKNGDGAADSKNIIFLKTDDRAGFRFFLYKDERFTFNVDPILGFTYKKQYDDDFKHRWNGLQFYGYFDEHFGFNFYFRDNEEFGSVIDTGKKVSPETGINIHKFSGNTLDYSETRGMISYSWESGNLSFGKDFLEWGSGYSGQLILSRKAPPFPFIKFSFRPVDWLQFTYIHGWLHSKIIDSSSIRTTLVEERESFFQKEKFIASHILSVYPLSNLSFSIGESVVYSDKLEPVYFIPVIFFRLADHYLSDPGSNSGDNAQIFTNTVYKNNYIRAKLYGTFFIDELSITNLLEGGNLSSVGYTIGINLIDPLVDNSGLIFEYTRVDPFVYMNSDDAHLYTNYGYQLGHWIGSNAEQIYFSFTKKILRGLSVKFSAENIRKGQTELPEQQYQKPYPDILYGSRLNITTAGIDVNYEILHEFSAGVEYQYSYITDREPRRLPSFRLGVNHIFGVWLGYGF